jgi:hypothetical protein
MKTPVTLAVALALALVATAPLLARGSDDNLIFRVEDPAGDDNGDGTIRYPLNYYDMRPGDLDLVAFEARRVDGGTELTFTFAGSIRRTDRRTIDGAGGSLDDLARFGFFQQNVDVYIDTDRVVGSGGFTTLPGRKAEIAESSAWERAVVLTPRPFDARSALKRLLMRQLKDELETGTDPAQVARLKGLIPDEVEQHIFFPNRIDVRGSRITAFVPDSFLGGPAQPTWSYVVFSSGAQIDQRFDFSETTGLARSQSMMIVPVAPGGAQDRFGGKRDDDYQQPPILDLLTGPGQNQKQLLSAYDAYRKRPVVLPGLVPAGPVEPGKTAAQAATPPVPQAATPPVQR